MPSSSGQYFGYSCLKQTDIWKKKQDNRTAMQILRSGQHLRVYGIGLPQRKYIRLWGTIQGTQSEG